MSSLESEVPKAMWKQGARACGSNGDGPGHVWIVIVYRRLITSRQTEREFLIRDRGAQRRQFLLRFIERRDDL
jgi:hypothetical protein